MAAVLKVRETSPLGSGLITGELIEVSDQVVAQAGLPMPLVVSSLTWIKCLHGRRLVEEDPDLNHLGTMVLAFARLVAAHLPDALHSGRSEISLAVGCQRLRLAITTNQRPDGLGELVVLVFMASEAIALRHLWAHSRHSLRVEEGALL